MSGTPSAIRSGIASSSPASLGLGPGGQYSEVGRLGPGLDLPGRPAALGIRAAPQPGQPLGGDHLSDPGPAQRRALGGQRPGDLIDRVPARAQLQDPGPGGVLARRGLRAGPAGDEELPRPGAEVSHRRQQRGGGVAEPGGRLAGGQPLGQVGAQRLIPPLRRRLRAEEELPARPAGQAAEGLSLTGRCMQFIMPVAASSDRYADIGLSRDELHGCSYFIPGSARRAASDVIRSA